MRLLLLFLFAFGIAPARAYFDYVPNANLAEEIEAHPYRVLPHNEHFSIAVDADFFKPVFLGGNNFNYYKFDFYHGNGYWLNLRTEFKANPDLAVNIEADVTHGTSSNGPTYLALIIPRVALTYRWHQFLGLDWETRLSDVGRQTIATGLFIEQKETDGGYITAKRGEFSGKVMVDGTGSFRLDGGVIASEFFIANGLIGITSLIQETETGFHAPQFTSTLFSKLDFANGFGYGVEWGGNQVAKAGLAYVQYRGELESFHYWIKPQFRTYGAGIVGALPTRIQHNYVSYDQNDKPFTNLMDIFAYGDHVETYSAQVNGEYLFNSFYRAYGETEFINYQFHERNALRAVFFRAGFKFYPFKDRADEFGLLVGNKYLIASTSQIDPSQTQRTYSSPTSPDFENKPLFMQQVFVMVNFSTKL